MHPDRMDGPQVVEAIAVRSPKPNTYAEHFVRSIKESCLERLILFGERSLRIAVREFVRHCHMERNHQGLNTHQFRQIPNILPTPASGWEPELLLPRRRLTWSPSSL